MTYTTTTCIMCGKAAGGCGARIYVMPHLLMDEGHFHCPECGRRFDKPTDEEVRRDEAGQ